MADEWVDVPDNIQASNDEWVDVPEEVNVQNNGEITNPTAKSWNLFPTTVGMVKNPTPFSALLPIAPIADAARDIGILGKTIIQQPLADKSMDFGTRLRHNLASTQSLGTEVANNYIPALAEEALSRGEDPNITANKLALVHGVLSNAVDIGGFFGTDGKQGVEQLVRGGSNIFNKIKGTRSPDLSNIINEMKPNVSAVDESPMYQQWLEKNAQPIESSPLLNIPKEVNKPTLAEDVKTVLTGLNTKGSTSGGRFTPEGKAAIERFNKEHLPAILADVKATGRTIEESIKTLYPDLTPDKIAVVAAQAKIGNFNLKQYPEEQQKQIQELFKGQEEKLVTKPMTQKDIVNKAKELSTFPVTEAMKRSTEGQLAAEKVNLKMSNIAKLKAISEDDTLSSMDRVKKILQLDTQSVKKIDTETGRALGAGNIPLQAHEEFLKSMRSIVDKLREDPNLDSASSKALINKIREAHPELKENVTGAQIFKFLFRNFITSGPLTLTANATSGAGAIAARPAMRALEISSAKIRSLLSGTPTSATYKEIGAMLKGMSKAIKGEQLPDTLKATTFSDKYQTSPMASLAATAETKAGQATFDTLDKVIGYPERVMRVTDDAIKNTLGMMEKEAATARGENVLSDQHVIERITSAQSRLTFQDEMSKIGKFISRLRTDYSKSDPSLGNQATDIITYSLQPFVHTVDRIIMGGWNLSGIGTAKTALKAITGRYKGSLAKGIARDERTGEMLDRDIAAAMIGAPLFIWTGMQLAQGNLTANAPKDTAGREAFGNVGKTEYAFRSGDRWIPTRLLPEPLATAIQINVAIHKGLSEAKEASDSVGVAAFKTAVNVGYMLGTKQYLSGMNSLISTMTNKGYDTPNELPVAKKLLGTAIPSIVKDVGVVSNTLQNRPRVMADTAMETVKRRVGATKGMVPELNTFGEEVTHPMMGRINETPAALLAEKFPPSPVPRIREGVKLSQQDYYELKKNIGTQRKNFYTTLSNSKKFMDAPKGVQKYVVGELDNIAVEVGSTPQRIKELKKDPLYYDRTLRTLLEIDKPGGERHFPFLKK